MSGERDIEKQLRAAADQRRQDTGGKFELHPATRRLLQGEVVRVRGQKLAAPRRSFWPRFAWGLPLVAVLMIGAWVFVDSHQRQNQIVAVNKPVPRGGETAGFVQNLPLPTAATPAPGWAVNGLPTAPADSSVATAAAEPVSAATPPPVVLAGGAAVSRKLADVPEVTKKDKEKPVTLAFDRLAPAPVAAPPAKKAMSALSPAAPAQRQILNFSNAADKSGSGNFALAQQQFKKELAKSVADAGVLVSFQLEQNGNQVRIVDTDGSIYEGALLADARDEDSLDRPRATAAQNAVVTDGAKLGAEKMPAQNFNFNGGAQNFRFAVAGTNLSLRQRVTINGEFLAATNAVNLGALQKNSNQQLKAGVQGGGGLPNGRVQGWAVTADGQQVKLDAEEVRLK